MKLANGEEVIARLELPLPVTVAAALIKGMADTLEGLGWTDVMYQPDTGRVTAKPPARDMEEEQ